jgi:hypothetical protein
LIGIIPESPLSFIYLGFSGRGSANILQRLSFPASLEEQEMLCLQQANPGHLQRGPGDPQEDGTGQEAEGGLGSLTYRC